MKKKQKVEMGMTMLEAYFTNIAAPVRPNTPNTIEGTEAVWNMATTAIAFFTKTVTVTIMELVDLFLLQLFVWFLCSSYWQWPFSLSNYWTLYLHLEVIITKQKKLLLRQCLSRYLYRWSNFKDFAFDPYMVSVWLWAFDRIFCVFVL